MVWLSVFDQFDPTAELLFLPVFGLCWAGNGVLGSCLLRGKRWARICLGAEGLLFLIYFCSGRGLGLPHCPAWLSVVVFRLGTFLVGVLPYAKVVFIPLGIASLCALRGRAGKPPLSLADRP